MRYELILNEPDGQNIACSSGKDDQERLDFMFFSNASGKILLSRSETIRSGKGTVLKTTANTDYMSIMEKEFATMSSLVEKQNEAPCFPLLREPIKSGNRTFFAEEYVTGRSLREVLHSLGRKNDVERICAYIDRLDEWYSTYSSLFQNSRKPLSSCYEHLFTAFNALYGLQLDGRRMLDKAHAALAIVVRRHNNTMTIVAHNDLWPGNFIVDEDRLVAIDWERATPDRAPFFDYYWLIISAVLEYHVCRIGTVDYSRAFRIFLEGKDAVSREGLDKLMLFLEKHSLDERQHQSLLFLFLMEWSVQGYLALGSQTAMDRLAYGELSNYFRK